MENKKFKCFKVTCRDDIGNDYVVGVMSYTMESAKECAVDALLEGRCLKTKAVDAFETEKI